MTFTYNEIQSLLPAHTIVSNLNNHQIIEVENHLRLLAINKDTISVDELIKLPFYNNNETSKGLIDNSDLISEFSLHFTRDDVVKFIIVLLIELNKIYKEKIEDYFYDQIDKVDVDFKLVKKIFTCKLTRAQQRKIISSPLKLGFDDFLIEYKEAYERAKKADLFKYKDGINQLFNENITSLDKNELLANIIFMEKSDNDDEYFFLESKVKCNF